MICTSCASIRVKNKTVDVLIRKKTKISKPVQHKYHSDCKLKNSYELHCKIQTEDYCTKTHIKVVDRTSVVERTTDNGVILGEYIGSALSFGAGVGLCVGAKYLPSGSSLFVKEEEQIDEFGKTDAYVIGTGLLLTGTVLLSSAIYHNVQIKDSQRHVGIVEVPISTKKFLCKKKHNLSGGAIALLIGKDELKKVILSKAGEFTVDLRKTIPKNYLIGKMPTLELSIFHFDEKLEQIDLLDYRMWLCEDELDRIVRSETWGNYDKFSSEFPIAHSIVRNRSRFSVLVKHATQLVESSCQQHFKKKEEELCLKGLKKLVLFSGNPQEVENLQVKYRNIFLDRLYLQGRQLFKKRKIDDVRNILTKCSEFDDSHNGCKKLSNMIDKYDEKIRRREERRWKEKERRKKKEIERNIDSIMTKQIFIAIRTLGLALGGKATKQDVSREYQKVCDYRRIYLKKNGYKSWLDFKRTFATAALNHY